MEKILINPVFRGLDENFRGWMKSLIPTEDFYVFNDKFSVKAIICMPYSNHHSCLIKTNKKVDYIGVGGSYYYDSQKFNNSFSKLRIICLILKEIIYLTY